MSGIGTLAGLALLGGSLAFGPEEHDRKALTFFREAQSWADTGYQQLQGRGKGRCAKALQAYRISLEYLGRGKASAAAGANTRGYSAGATQAVDYLEAALVKNGCIVRR